MKTTQKTFLSFFCMLIFSSWIIKFEKQSLIPEWLLGTWEIPTTNGIIYETWTSASDSEIQGKSFIIRKSDTVVVETIQLIEERDSLFYIPLVRGQNNNLPVRFVSKTISESELVFENLAHDFPQRIRYKRVGEDSLIAEISGLQKGQELKQTFPMKRIQ